MAETKEEGGSGLANGSYLLCFFLWTKKKKRFSLGALSGRDIWSLNNWLSLPRTSRRETLPRSFGSTAFRFSLVLFCLVFVRSLVSYLVALVCALLSGNKRNVLTGPTVPLPAIKKKKSQKTETEIEEEEEEEEEDENEGNGRGKRTTCSILASSEDSYIIYDIFAVIGLVDYRDGYLCCFVMPLVGAMPLYWLCCLSSRDLITFCVPLQEVPRVVPIFSPNFT